ncbi:MAG: hypothetical protein HY805_00255 [Nitrospirae bacterium]|nr:hypothetical protein [Nitrospirota bacterium]
MPSAQTTFEGTLILLPYQQRWVNDKSPLKIWLAGRQVGKSFSIAMEAMTEALESKCNNLILSSSERQSKEVMQKVYSFLRYFKVRSDEIIKAERETKEEVQLPNGSRIISLPANPDTVRGFSGNVFLDEFAFHKDSREIWRAMYPTVTRGYKVRVTSTPNGKQNMFYELWNLGGQKGDLEKEGQGGFSKHKTDIYDAVAEGLKVDIEQLRQGIGDPDSWAGEFECRFVDEATAFITYEMITSCEDEGATKEITNPPISPFTKGGQEGDYFLGVDIGRKHDLTVFWLWEKVGDVFWSRMVKEMKGATFKEQRDFLFSLMEGGFSLSFPPHLSFPLVGNPSEEGLRTSRNDKKQAGMTVRRCCIDSTGLGMQLSEEAVERFGSRIEAITFTGKVKEDLAITMRRKFEDRQVRIPIDKNIRDDIHSVKKFTTSAGNIRFDAERTEQGHSDRFWASSLGIHAGQMPEEAISYESLSKRSFLKELI